MRKTQVTPAIRNWSISSLHLIKSTHLCKSPKQMSIIFAKKCAALVKGNLYHEVAGMGTQLNKRCFAFLHGNLCDELWNCFYCFAPKTWPHDVFADSADLVYRRSLWSIII